MNFKDGKIRKIKNQETYENNNYFKLVSYRKNYLKHEKGENIGKYINLDFGMLEDLSIIDMRLRKTMLSIVLDLEHYAKVKLLSRVESITKDGYTLVEEYIEDLKNKNEYQLLENELNKNIKGTYCGDLVAKYKGEYPIWVFVEIIPFGRFVKFYMFAANKLKDKGMLKEYNNTFTSNDYRILDIIRILSYNEKKDNYSLNRLIKESDIITVSLGMSEIYNKILTIDDLVMLFFDKAPQMLFKLVMLFNDNISFFDDNVFISIFNSLPNVIYIYLTFSISDKF